MQPSTMLPAHPVGPGRPVTEALPWTCKPAPNTCAARSATTSGLNATLKFDCGADGVAVIDGKSVPNTRAQRRHRRRLHGGHHAGQPGALLTGELEPATGFMMGKFKVSGDMSVAMKLQRVV
jgi:putative sterol carrier protein